MKTLEAAQDASTSLAPVQGTQLVTNFPSQLLPITTTEEPVEEKRKEDSTQYCPICTPMGKECQGRKTTSDWDNVEKEDSRDIPKPAVVTPFPSPQQPITYKQK